MRDKPGGIKGSFPAFVSGNDNEPAAGDKKLRLSRNGKSEGVCFGRKKEAPGRKGNDVDGSGRRIEGGGTRKRKDEEGKK